MRIVWTNGCFDIIHRGHIELFKYARGLGDKLVVGIDSDEKVETAIEEVEKIDTTDTKDTIDTKDSITLSYTKRAETPNKSYNTRWNSLSDKIVWDLESKGNTFKYLNTMQIINTAYYKTQKTIFTFHCGVFNHEI